MPELGIGYLSVAGELYDAAYWERYRGLDRTPSGDALTAMRIDLVSDFYAGDIVDVGIGGGRFVEDRPGTYGFDVNPAALEWLAERSLFRDPYRGARACTFWDSLEHIEDPGRILSRITEFAFVSLPIFDGPDHAIRSKHFKPGEHIWYFTDDGFVRFMRAHGFGLRFHDRREEAAGREGIGTFVFQREARPWPRAA